MRDRGKAGAAAGIVLIALFLVWTVLIQCVDVQQTGVNGTKIGFASVNTWFHNLTGVHMWIYTATDWLSAVPFVICLGFCAVGLIQLIRTKSIMKVDRDILLLGIYYIMVILAYLLFEKIVINYRPILIEGAMETSYPSSTTLLVLSVLPTLNFQIGRRARSESVRRITAVFVYLFSAFMVIGRLVSGVHWLTDIIGGVLLSSGLFMLYRAAVAVSDSRQVKTSSTRHRRQ